MKQSVFLLVILLLVMHSYGQKSADTKTQKTAFALKAGLNFANVSSGSLNTSSRAGFMVGVYLAPPASGVLGYRSEINFSRQEYEYNGNGTSGRISQDYLLLPQLMTLNLTKFFQLQLGGQLGILLNAKDSSLSSSSVPYPYAPTKNYFKKLSYGLTAGIEVFPIRNLLVGARSNFDFGSIAADATTAAPPPFIPLDRSKLRNYTLQLYLGVRI